MFLREVQVSSKKLLQGKARVPMVLPRLRSGSEVHEGPPESNHQAHDQASNWAKRWTRCDDTHVWRWVRSRSSATNQEIRVGVFFHAAILGSEYLCFQVRRIRKSLPRDKRHSWPHSQRSV